MLLWPWPFDLSNFPYMPDKIGWLRGIVVEGQFLTGKLSLSCADGWPIMWVNRPL